MLKINYKMNSYNVKLDYSKLIKKVLLFLGITIFVLFVYSIDWKSVPAFIKAFSNKSILILFAVAIILTVVNLIFKSYRWKLLAQNVTEKKVSFKFALLSIMTGIAAASFVPGRVELAKPLLLKT